MQVAIVSGKGGVGKTSFVSAFATLVKQAVFVDCDINSPDLHLIFSPENSEMHNLNSHRVVSVQQEECIRCGLCYNICRFDSVDRIRNQYYIREFSCESCDLCRKACPVSAIVSKDKITGSLYISNTRFGPLVHTKLNVGEEVSAEQVAIIREKANQLGVIDKPDFILIDGPPGIGLPTIASINGVDRLVVIAEPSSSGIYSLKRLYQLLVKLNIPIKLIINKCDLNPVQATEIKNYSLRNGIEVVAEIPFDRSFTHAMIQQNTILEYSDNTQLITKITDAWKAIIR